MNFSKQFFFDSQTTLTWKSAYNLPGFFFLILLFTKNAAIRIYYTSKPSQVLSSMSLCKLGTVYLAEL